MSNYRTPLSRVKGLGSAKEGTDHFWAQRLTAIALIPLVLWLTFSIASLPDMDYLAIREWLSQPFNAIVMILFMIAGFSLPLHLELPEYSRYCELHLPVKSHLPATSYIFSPTAAKDRTRPITRYDKLIQNHQP